MSSRSTFAGIVAACSAVEQAVLPVFGPGSGSVLVLSYAGTALVTRSGADVLKALVLAHPAAKLLANSAQQHAQVFGDGATTCVLMIAAGLREAQRLVSCGETTPSLLAVELGRLVQVLPGLLSTVENALVIQGCTRDVSTSIVNTVLAGMVDSEARRVLSDIVMNVSFRGDTLLCCEKFLCIWPVHVVPGASLHTSAVYDGVLIRVSALHSSMVTTHGATYCVVLKFPAAAVAKVSAKSEQMHADVDAVAMNYVESLYQRNVRVIVCTGTASSRAFAHYCAVRGITLVETDTQTAMSVCDVLQVEPVALVALSISSALAVANIEGLQMREIGGVMFAHIRVPSPYVASVILRAPSAAVAHQYNGGLKRCVTALLQWIRDSSRAVPGGAAYEVAVATTLELHMKKVTSRHHLAALRVAAAAVMTVPRCLLPSATRIRAIHAVRHHLLQEKYGFGLVKATTGTAMWRVDKPADEGIVESLCSKQNALGATLSTIAQLVRVDMLLHTQQQQERTGRLSDTTS